MRNFLPRVYCLTYQGEGFKMIGAEDSQPKPYGFYTVRWVRTDSEQEAETAGLVDVKHALRERGVEFLAGAWIHLDKIHEASFRNAVLHWFGLRRRTGFAFYALEDDDGPLRTYVDEGEDRKRRWRDVAD